MTVTAVSHIAIGVTDVDRALAFYRDVLGMHVTQDRTQEFDDVSRDRKVRRRSAWLRWSEGDRESALVLDQRVEPPPSGAPVDLFDLGTHHVSFWVEDVDAVLQRAKAGGFEPIFPHVADTKDYGETAGGKIRSSFFQDPDGNFVQIDQRL